MAYLNRLLSRGEGAEHADLLIKLYADYERGKLLPYMRRAENYKIDKALEICKKKNYIEEVNFGVRKLNSSVEGEGSHFPFKTWLPPLSCHL